MHSKGNHICWVSPECPDQHVIWFDSNKGCIGMCRCFQAELHACFCSSSPSSSVSSVLVTAQHHGQSVVLPKAALAPDSGLTPRAQQRVQLSLCCRHFWSSLDPALVQVPPSLLGPSISGLAPSGLACHPLPIQSVLTQHSERSSLATDRVVLCLDYSSLSFDYDVSFWVRVSFLLSLLVRVSIAVVKTP